MSYIIGFPVTAKGEGSPGGTVQQRVFAEELLSELN